MNFSSQRGLGLKPLGVPDCCETIRAFADFAYVGYFIRIFNVHTVLFATIDRQTDVCRSMQ